MDYILNDQTFYAKYGSNIEMERLSDHYGKYEESEKGRHGETESGRK